MASKTDSIITETLWFAYKKKLTIWNFARALLQLANVQISLAARPATLATASKANASTVLHNAKHFTSHLTSVLCISNTNNTTIKQEKHYVETMPVSPTNTPECFVVWSLGIRKCN